MNLGLNRDGNNSKYIVLNFLVMAGSQIVFRLDDLLSKGCWPSPLECAKVLTSSLVATLIFYGFNKMQNKKSGDVSG